MLRTVVPLLAGFLLIVLTVVVTHLLVSLAQTLMHRQLGHRPLGGRLFRNHIGFHHVHYARNHLVSATYAAEEGNNTPYFLLLVLAVGAGAYLILPVEFFVIHVVTCAASFYAHVLFDREYHIEGSRFLRFAWFRRKQALHFVHHRHANTNFAVIDFFWDRLLGTFRQVDETT